MQFIEKKVIALKRNFITGVIAAGFNSFCMVLPFMFFAFLLSNKFYSAMNAVTGSVLVAYSIFVSGILVHAVIYTVNKYRIKKSIKNNLAVAEVYVKRSKAFWGKYMNVTVKHNGLELFDNRGKIVFLPIAKHCKTDHFTFKQCFGLFEKSIDKYSFEIEPGLMYSIFDEYEQEELARVLNSGSMIK